jgi:hypothetical protein
VQSRIYAYAWYLDIVADNWSVLVLNDYEAVMPLPFRKKYGVTYVYPPFWLLELGIFSKENQLSIAAFIKPLLKKYRFVELRFNTQNNLINTQCTVENRKLQYLNLNSTYAVLLEDYQKDKRKELRKAARQGLTSKWNDAPENLLLLFKNNVGKRIPEIEEKEYEVLLKLMQECIARGLGEILSVYDKSALVASGFFLKHQHSITLLVSSTDFKNRSTGANTFLIDRAIYQYHKEYDKFCFGGSSIESIAQYFKSFGAETSTYFLLKKRFF